MAHTCKALVIHCIDFRFHTAIREWLISQKLQDTYDVVSIAGAAKGLVDGDETSKEVIMKQIDISERLHKISKIILIQHMDCGAYGGHSAFASEAEERSRHSLDLEKATKVIHEQFPNLSVVKVIASISAASVGKPVIAFTNL